jgi:regulator of protease activity HflC (stomatin/prohibitin superfamily)
MTIAITFLALGLVGAALWYCVVVVVRHGERGVLESWGRFVQVLEPGLWVLMPLRDRLVTPDWSRSVERNGTVFQEKYGDWRVRMAETTYDMPPVKCRTSDGLWATVNMTTVYKITDPWRAAYEVDNMWAALQDALETTLVALVRERDSNRLRTDELEQAMLAQLEKPTAKWGVALQTVRLQNIALPQTVEQASLGSVQDRRKQEAELASVKAQYERQIAQTRGEAAVEDAKREKALQCELGLLESERKLAEVRRAQALQQQTHEAALQENRLVMAQREAEQREALKAAEWRTQRESGMTEAYWIAKLQQESLSRLSERCKVMILPPETMASQLGVMRALDRDKMAK